MAPHQPGLSRVVMGDEDERPLAPASRGHPAHDVVPLPHRYHAPEPLAAPGLVEVERDQRSESKQARTEQPSHEVRQRSPRPARLVPERLDAHIDRAYVPKPL